MAEEPKVWASIGTTINLGNYENQKIDIGLTGIPVGASDEYIQEMGKQATITIQKVVAVLATEMTRMLADGYGR